MKHKFTFLPIFILFCSTNAWTQFDTINWKTRNIISVFPNEQIKTNGLRFSIMQKQVQFDNGISLILIGDGIFSGVIPYDFFVIKDSVDLIFVNDSLDYLLDNKMNGFFISTFGVISFMKLNGIAINGFGYYISQVNGWSISLFESNSFKSNGLITTLGFSRIGQMKGLQIAGFATTNYLSGVQIGLFNNCSTGKGIQIGLVRNVAGSDFRGLQMGLINSIGKRTIPIVNLKLKKNSAR